MRRLAGIIFLLFVVVAHSQAQEELLSELVAGSEANVALMREGTVSYQVKSQTFSPKTRQNDYVLTFFLDHDRVRMDGQTDRYILEPDRNISLSLIDLARSPKHASAIIRTPEFAPPRVGDPRRNGLCSHFEGIGELIRKLQTGENTRITVTQEGALTKLAVVNEPMEYKAEYWVAPREGFGVVRYQEWAMRTPEAPFSEVKSQFVKVSNGAYIVSSQEWVFRAVSRDGKFGLNKELRLQLQSETIGKPVSPKVFTLAGLGVVREARVQDRINGKEYLFGVSAVDENTLGRLPVSGPDRPHLLPIAFAVQAVIVIGLTAWWWIRRRAHRRRQSML